MQYIYYDTYKNYTVGQIYEKFCIETYNHAQEFNDVIIISDAETKVFILNFKPIEQTFTPKVNKYASEADYNSGTIASTLVYWTDYYIDFALWILTFTNDYTPVEWEYYEVIAKRWKINLRQFVEFLNKWLRVLNKYFPIKWIEEYTSAMAWWAEEIEYLDVTNLPFLDINSVYDSITSPRPISMIRRWKYLVFNPITVTYQTDYWYDAEEKAYQKLPIYIEWNYAPSHIQWSDNIDEVLNQEFRFAEVWYDALTIYCMVEMYTNRLHYNETIVVSTIKINTMWISNLIRQLNTQLASIVWDSSIAKWFYYAWGTWTPQVDLQSNGI